MASILVNQAEHAYAFRRMEELENLSQLLSTLPDPHRKIGLYYHALFVKRQGRLEEARTILEQLSEAAPQPYRAKAILSSAAVALAGGDLGSASKLYLEAGRAAVSRGHWDPEIAINSQRACAVLAGIDGDHSGAVAHLEQIFPMVRAASTARPCMLYDHLNNLAVELMEVGRLDEAANASRIALASPYAQAYPEWHETWRDISLNARRASKSVVAVSNALPADPPETPTLLAPEQVAPSPTPSLQPLPRPARILAFPHIPLQQQVDAPQAAQITARELKQMSLAEKRGLLLAAAQNPDTSEEVCDKLLQAAGLVVDRDQGPKQIDLESSGVLEDMVALWINEGIKPEQLAAVMSALRDCDDELRRRNILDRMISYAFNETRFAIEGEERWRKRVEARLNPDPRPVFPKDRTS